MEAHRRATAVALGSLHSELETLRTLHEKEMEAVRRAADEEHARLRQWCTAQLSAVETNRDALLGELAERREGLIATSDEQLARVVSEHRQQQAAMRKLLAQENERCSAARAEVLALTVASGNERLALHAEVLGRPHAKLTHARVPVPPYRAYLVSDP